MPMDASEYYRSLTLEMDAVQNRVRNLIGNVHWPTDGEWKETVLRTILRRHLPPTVSVGRGFIVGPRHPSSQIDLLIYDTSFPVLHQDGDLVFVVPDAVRAIIEVKTRIHAAHAESILTKLADSAEIITNGAKKIFLGLFAFEDSLGADPHTPVLRALQLAANGQLRRAINHVCVGPSTFFRFWANNPENNAQVDEWRSYSVQQMARGYFVFNALESVVGDAVRKNLWAWFPRDGKEIHLETQAPLRPDAP